MLRPKVSAPLVVRSQSGQDRAAAGTEWKLADLPLRAVVGANVTIVAANVVSPPRSVLIGHVQIARRRQIRTNGWSAAGTQTFIDTYEVRLQLLPARGKSAQLPSERFRRAHLRSRGCRIAACHFCVKGSNMLLHILQARGRSCRGLCFGALLFCSRLLRGGLVLRVSLQKCPEALGIDLHVGSLSRSWSERFQLCLFGSCRQHHA